MSQHNAVVVSILASVALSIASASAQTPPTSPPAQATAPAQPAPPPSPTPPPVTTESATPATPKAAPTDGTHKPSATEAMVVGLNTFEGVVSKSVRSENGNDDMGRIVDVLVDATGLPRAAVIDFGGFLGVGSRKVAVDWKALDFTNSIKNGNVKLSLTRDQVRQSPEYKTGEPVVVLEGAKTNGATVPQPHPDPAH